jgi:hypothetical protein
MNVEKFCIVAWLLMPPEMGEGCTLRGVACRLLVCPGDAIEVVVGMGSRVGANGAGAEFRAGSLALLLGCGVGGVATPIGDSIRPTLVGAEAVRFTLLMGACVATLGAELAWLLATSKDRSSFIQSGVNVSTKR